MKLLIFSDLHLEQHSFVVPKGINFDVAVLAGDIHTPGRRAIEWARSDNGIGASKPIIFVAGNHEFYRTTMEVELATMREASVGTNLHVLDGDELVLNGVRILGCTLWTDFRLRVDVHAFPSDPGLRVQRVSDMRRAMARVERGMNDYYTIQTQVHGAEPTTLRAVDTLRIHRQQRNWLRRKLAEPFDGKTVVVTHHAPHGASVMPRYKSDWTAPGFVSELPSSFFDVPKLWIHGHTHAATDYQVGNCRVVSNPRGYMMPSGVPENQAFEPGFVIEV